MGKHGTSVSDTLSTYSVLMNIHVDSVEASVSALTKRVPLVDTNEAFKDGNVGAVAFSVTGNVSDHVVSFNVAVGRARSATIEWELCMSDLQSTEVVLRDGFRSRFV